MKCTDKPFAVSREYELTLLHKRDVYKAETGAKQPLRIVMISAEGIAGVANTENISFCIDKNDLFS